MSLSKMAGRNLRRRAFRTSLTVLGLAIAVVAFVALRTVLTAWSAAADYAAKDRLGSRHKMSFIMSLPKKYGQIVRGVPGVKAATWLSWFGAKNPRNPDAFFGSMAADTDTFLEVYDEISLPPEQKASWLKTKKGAIVGEVLAKELGVKVGDVITLEGTIYPGPWEFEISGIYHPTRQSIDRMSLFFHWAYLNDALPERQRDNIGWIVSRVDHPATGSQIAKNIDRLFDERDVPTLTQSERDMNLSFLGMVSGILKALDVVSIVILGIMLMILGNTIAMGVRERTREHGVLRALGFTSRHLVTAILTEAACVGVMGGLLGLALAYPLIQRGLGGWLEQNMGSYFPYFRIDPATAVTALSLCGGLGLAAAVVPAWSASRLVLTDALRKVD